MKQTINLLRDDLKPVIQRLTLNRMSALVVGLLLCALGMALYTGISQQHSQQQVARLQQQLADVQQRHEQILQRVQSRTPSTTLLQQQQALENAIAAQQQLNAQLAEQQPAQRGSPDQLMHELFQVDIEGLWLTQFSMSAEGMSLVGTAIRANLLPRWMQRFQAMPLLSESRFAVVDLDRNPQGQQTFALTNQPTTTDDTVRPETDL